MKAWLDLIWAFIKIGASTFGSAYAMILKRELIRKKGWITMEEVMDCFTIAQVMPGIIAVNIPHLLAANEKARQTELRLRWLFFPPGCF